MVHTDLYIFKASTFFSEFFNILDNLWGYSDLMKINTVWHHSSENEQFRKTFEDKERVYDPLYKHSFSLDTGSKMVSQFYDLLTVLVVQVTLDHVSFNEPRFYYKQAALVPKQAEWKCMPIK